jgi:hypothetical protein
MAQNSKGNWTKADKKELQGQELYKRDWTPSQSAILSLDVHTLDQQLENTILRQGTKKGQIIKFPVNDVDMESFEIFKSAIMHPDLSAKYPNIKTYIGFSVTNPKIRLQFTTSPRGLRATINNREEGTIYIDPISKDGRYHELYTSKDIPTEVSGFTCDFKDELETTADNQEEGSFNKNANDGTLRIFKFAVGTTFEFSDYHIVEAGVSNGSDADKKAAVMVPIVELVSYASSIYENELSVNFQLAANNDNAISLDVNDGLNGSSNGDLLDEATPFLNATVLTSNYDLGHMLTRTGGGVAYLAQSCLPGLKGGAVSGPRGSSLNPTPPNIAIVFLHEIGHTVGSPHTFNGNQQSCSGGNRSASAAYETGSGSTIMSYAGLCGSDNVQAAADNYFHQKSLDAIWSNIISGGGICADLMPTENSAPVADAGADYIIPSRTPYRLTGSSTDADGTASHTYTWEQYDLGPEGLPSPTLLEGPLVRSFMPNSSSTRYIPRLEDYLDVFGQSTTWEVMSSATRDINFKLTVRDNDVRGGQVAVDAMVVSVTNTSGPLRITSQNNNSISYEGLSTQTISWQVNGTNAGVGGAANVNILLSTDGGLTYDTTVLANTPNDGSQEVQIPNIDAANCRFMIEAVGNIFYNINFRDFAITQNLSIEDQELNNLSIYPNPNNGEFNIAFDPRSGEAITVEVYDIRGRVIYTKLYSSVSRFDEVISLNNAQSGVYLLTLSDGPLKVTKKIIID